MGLATLLALTIPSLVVATAGEIDRNPKVANYLAGDSRKSSLMERTSDLKEAHREEARNLLAA